MLSANRKENHRILQRLKNKKTIVIIRKDFQSPYKLRQILLNKDFPIPINEYKKAFKTQVLRGLA